MSTSIYPQDLDNIAPVHPGDTITSAHASLQSDAINAVQATLGIRPAGPYSDVADAIAGKADLSGAVMQGALAMAGHKVSGLPTPVDAQDAAPKGYVDQLVAAGNPMTLPLPPGTGTSYLSCTDGVVAWQEAGGSVIPPGTGTTLDGTTYMKRRAIVISNTGAARTDVPLRLQLDASNFSFSRVQGNGWDIRFTDSSDNLIPHFVQSWDHPGETAVIWVNIPDLPASSNTVIHVYYESPGATSASNAGTTFPTSSCISNLAAAFNFSALPSYEADATVPDLTGNGHDATLPSSGISITSARLSGTTLAIANASVTLAAALSLPSTSTVAFWVGPTLGHMSAMHSSVGNGSYIGFKDGNYEDHWGIRNPASGLSPNAHDFPFSAGWHHVSVVNDNGTVRLYLDGAQQGTTDPNHLTDVLTLFSSGDATPSTALDTVRIYSAALSSSQVAAISDPTYQSTILGAVEYMHLPLSNPPTLMVGNEQLA